MTCAKMCLKNPRHQVPGTNARYSKCCHCSEHKYKLVEHIVEQSTTSGSRTFLCCNIQDNSLYIGVIYKYKVNNFIKLSLIFGVFVYSIISNIIIEIQYKKSSVFSTLVHEERRHNLPSLLPSLS
jgi:hypothetical protein